MRPREVVVRGFEECSVADAVECRIAVATELRVLRGVMLVVVVESVWVDIRLVAVGMVVVALRDRGLLSM